MSVLRCVANLDDSIIVPSFVTYKGSTLDFTTCSVNSRDPAWETAYLDTKT